MQIQKATAIILFVPVVKLLICLVGIDPVHCGQIVTLMLGVGADVNERKSRFWDVIHFKNCSDLNYNSKEPQSIICGNSVVFRQIISRYIKRDVSGDLIIQNHKIS